MVGSEKHELHTEKDLLSRLTTGDVRAYETLYDQHYFSIFRFARKFVNNRAAAEDITTDVFMKLWNKRTDFESLSGVRSFLFTTTRNTCLNYLRDEKRHADIHHQLTLHPIYSESEWPRWQITEKIYQSIQEEIEKLPPKMKTILYLHLQGRKNEEIGGQLGISEKTVRNLKVEAIKLLKTVVLKKELLTLLLLLR